jgi:hypothetical protein
LPQLLQSTIGGHDVDSARLFAFVRRRTDGLAATIIKNIGQPRHELDDHANVIRPIRALSWFSRGLAG